RENWMNNFYKEDRPRVEKIMNESLENKETSSFAIEFNYIKESGALVPVSAHASIIRNEHGVPIRMVGSFLDITIQKEYEKSLQKLNENLAQSNKLLTISNNELEQFAYVTSHDLQEPLRMVTAFLSQLERKYSNVIDEKGKKYIYFAIDGAMRMRQIILDLLEYSKVGRSQESLKTINLNYLINEITPLYKKKIEETNASIFFEKLPIIKSFKTPLRQILHNLISNSLKYQGTENPIIKITVDELNEFWKISVKDNGIGIKEEFFDRIFIPFQRLHNKEKYSGTGIGLSIVKKTVETLGGEIWVESKEGVGSSFIFTIKKAT
ncbi:MAG: ATP-binding protein, partial [Ferruginibacter sp.]